MFIPPDQTRISKIQVYARVSFPHPYEKWCGHQVSLSLDAIVGNEDPEAAVRRLQGQVDRLLDEHKAAILKRLAEEEEPRQRQAATAFARYVAGPPRHEDAHEEGAARGAARLYGKDPEVSGHADPDH